MKHETEPILEGSSGREGSNHDPAAVSAGSTDAPIVSRNPGLTEITGEMQISPVNQVPQHFTQDSRPRNTLPRRQGDPEWMVAYIKLGRNGKGPAEHGERIFTFGSEAIAFFLAQRPGWASLWRAFGTSYVQQQLFPSEKGGAAKTVQT